jgi:metal-responsive CopG/Arc/MetJ family transcriptional regulator
MTLEPELLAAVDKAARQMRTTRSGFTRRALREALDAARTRDLERRQSEGYVLRPVRTGEFDGWEREQVWGD